MSDPLRTSIPVKPASMTASPKPASMAPMRMESSPASNMMSSTTTINVPENTARFVSVAGQVAVGSVLGIAAGLVVDKLFKKLQDGYNLKPLTIIIIQIIVMIIVMILVLYVLDLIGRRYFKRAQGDLLAPIVFSTFFISIQVNLFRNIVILGRQVARED